MALSAHAHQSLDTSTGTELQQDMSIPIQQQQQQQQQQQEQQHQQLKPEPLAPGTRATNIADKDFESSQVQRSLSQSQSQSPSQSRPLSLSPSASPSRSTSPYQDHDYEYPFEFDTDTVVSASPELPRPLALSSQQPQSQGQHQEQHQHQEQQQQPLHQGHQQEDHHSDSQYYDDVATPIQPVTSSAATPTAAATPRTSLNHIKRKPLSSTASVTASAFAVRFSQDSATTVPSPIQPPKPDFRFSRSGSDDSPTLYEYPAQTLSFPFPPSLATDGKLDSTKEEPAPAARNIPTVKDQQAAADPDLDPSGVESVYDDLLSDLTPVVSEKSNPSIIVKERQASSDARAVDHSDGESLYSDPIDRYNSPPPMIASKPTPPHLQLHKVDAPVEQDLSPTTEETQTPNTSQLNKPLPKSPSATSPFAAFFGWGGNPSPAGTEFSSLNSPQTPPRRDLGHDAAGNSLLSHHNNPNAASTNALGYCESYLSTPPPSNYDSAAHVEEMEEELKAISSELAASIRREMDLEDLVDRMQEQVNNPQAPSKRTSDYFSDSGYSSAKASEVDQNREEVEKIQRRSEQEKATLRLELTNKLSDERSKRKELDQQIKELAERASHIDLASMNNVDANERVRELENTCEDLRRRLSEERSSKDNFEDLLSALKGELHDACNERDNLRDEVVPQLRARVEGLETEAAEYANLTYESTKMQQELQSLKDENTTLRRGSIMADVPARGSRILSGGLSRSNSVATGGMRSQRPPMGLSRSNSIKGGQVESREAIAERLKDVEAQRDALHGALKNLLERQEFQNREYQKRIKFLEVERNRLITGPTKKGGFEREIAGLRTEINVLRRRAEDALEQKWQVEKGLGGLKMDLDRAEGEITALRDLLQEKDILIPETLARSSGSSTGSSNPVTSESLNEAYNKLQAAYSDSLERIKKLESEVSDDKTRNAVHRLEKALSVAVIERDSLKGRYDAASANEVKSVEAERALADELLESAQQVEQLASQVQQQLSANADLRMRLSDAVARGDADRMANNDRITLMMERLRGLEDELMSAQNLTEDQVFRHEEEVSKIREAHNIQLQRMNGNPVMGGLRSPALRSSRKDSIKDDTSKFPGSPRIAAASFADEVEMRNLRTKVDELERALSDAEKEMQEVITKMSTAQVEVLNLQEERDAAVRETRRLQKTLETEEMKSFEDRFKTLRGNVGL